ncbi:MAG TPA: hypothetical protein VHE30_16945 [Polyangiaceae bacterium]|nr:hypothetical protein [Polyangiaceae bacterium]
MPPWVSRSLLLVMVATSLVARTARCEEAAPEFRNRHVSVEGVVGFGTPVGSLGVLGRVDPLPWLSAGGGVGETLRGERVYGLLALFRPLVRRSAGTVKAFTVDAGYSWGASYELSPFCMDDCRELYTTVIHRVPDAHWVHVQLGGEVRFEPSGLFLRGFAGIARIVNPNSGPCSLHDEGGPDVSAPCDSIGAGRGNVLSLGLTVGYALPI